DWFETARAVELAVGACAAHEVLVREASPATWAPQLMRLLDAETCVECVDAIRELHLRVWRVRGGPWLGGREELLASIADALVRLGGEPIGPTETIDALSIGEITFGSIDTILKEHIVERGTVEGLVDDLRERFLRVTDPDRRWVLANIFGNNVGMGIAHA